MISVVLVAVLAQVTPTDTLRGVVTDSAGQPLPRLLVEVDGRGVRTDSAGRWAVPAGRDARPRVTVPGYEVLAVRAAGGGWVVVVRAAPLALRPLVVTAARRPQSVAEAATAVTVWEGADLRGSGGSSVADALERLGVLVLEGGVGAGLGPTLDGLGEQRVLVLVDGQPWDGRVGGQIDLSRLPLGEVDRVEIVRGPQSVLYGTSAMGGVIHVITRSPRGRGVRAAGRWGSLGQRGLEVAADARLGAVALGAGGGWQRSALVPGLGDADGTSDRTHSRLQVGWAAGAWRVRLRALSAWDAHRWRAGTLHQFVDDEEAQLQGEVGRAIGSGEVMARAVVHTFLHGFRRSSSSSPPPGVPAERHQRWEAEVTGGWSDRGGGWTAGLEVAREALVSDRLADGRRARTSGDVFVQRDWQLRSATVAPGLRLTWSSDGALVGVPRLATRWDGGRWGSVYLAVGRSYRLPDFKEQAIAFVNRSAGGGYVVEGNPDLRPEDAWGLTADLAGGSAAWRWSVHLYGQRLRNLIQAVYAGERDGLTLYRYANVDRATLWGGEAAVDGARGPWSYGLTLAALRGRQGDGALLLGRPPVRAALRVSWSPARRVAMAVYGRWLASTPLLRDETGTLRRPAAWRADAVLRWVLSPRWTAELSVDRAAGGGGVWPEWGPRRWAVALRWGPASPPSSATPFVGGL